jgi:tRNA-specific 2-thiouridylase
VAARGPVYALSTDAATNTVVVGPKTSLAQTSVRVRGGRLHVPVARADVKLRHRAPAAPATVVPDGEGFRLELDTPAYGIAAGQAAVLYEEGAVVGAGLIAATE